MLGAANNSVDRLGSVCYNVFTVKEKKQTMIEMRPGVNEFEAIVVMEKLRVKGVTNATLIPGNGCIWAQYGMINEYYIFSKGLLVDIQID